MRKRNWSKEFIAWRNMIRRCYNPKDPSFHNYGGRGITVCSRWRAFDNFLYDMQKSPIGTELDRINTNDGYYPLNCRWVSKAENARSRRSTKLSHDKVRILRGLLAARNPNVTLKRACEVFAPLFNVHWMSVYNVATQITWK